MTKSRDDVLKIEWLFFKSSLFVNFMTIAHTYLKAYYIYYVHGFRYCNFGTLNIPWSRHIYINVLNSQKVELGSDVQGEDKCNPKGHK